MKTIQEIKTDFQRTFAEVSTIPGLTVTDTIEIAIAVLREFGKYNRGEAANTARMNGNGNNGSEKPASEKQIKFLRDLGVAVKQGMTSKEASTLIEQSRNKKGR